MTDRAGGRKRLSVRPTTGVMESARRDGHFDIRCRPWRIASAATTQIPERSVLRWSAIHEAPTPPARPRAFPILLSFFCAPAPSVGARSLCHAEPNTSSTLLAQKCRTGFCMRVPGYSCPLLREWVTRTGTCRRLQSQWNARPWKVGGATVNQWGGGFPPKSAEVCLRCHGKVRGGMRAAWPWAWQANARRS